MKTQKLYPVPLTNDGSLLDAINEFQNTLEGITGAPVDVQLDEEGNICFLYEHYSVPSIKNTYPTKINTPEDFLEFNALLRGNEKLLPMSNEPESESRDVRDNRTLPSL